MTSKKIEHFFWLGVVLLVVFCLSFHSAEIEWNQDLGRHIRLGEIILEEKSIPKINFFSYLEVDFPFQNHHWLSEVVLALIYNNFGNSGLILFKTLLLVLAWGGLFWLASQTISPSWAAFLILLPILIFRERTDIRPEIFGFLLFGLFLIIFTKARKGKKKLLWCLPLLQLLWVNLHISFVFGLFLIGVNFFWFWQKKLFSSSKKAGMVLLPLFLAVLANLVNPNFINGALAPLLIWQNYGYQIVENQSVFFLSALGYRGGIVLFKIGFILGLVFFIANRKSLIDFLAWLALSIISARQIRHLPFWALYSFWFWASTLQFFLKKVSQKTRLFFDWGAKITALLAASFLVLIHSTGLIYRWSDQNKNFGFGGNQPTREAALFLVNNFPKEKIFNNFDIGSYLDYFYPEIRVFADSRPEAYPAFFWQEYRAIQSDWNKWQEIVEKYQIGVVFFSHTDQTDWAKNFLVNLYQDEKWRLVYLDGDIVIYSNIEAGPEELIINKELVDYFDNGLDLAKLARFFHLVGEEELYRLSLEKSLKLNPHSYFTNLSLAQVYFQSNSPALHFKAKSLTAKINNWWYRL
ncbi:MAG: hypothetical protein PHR64_02530 [Candidatus Shapirobacteria bacterium]|nr:hypothetical protein [Candidatus Shapirobacteria bacterium]MDD5074074.1 hypothetical protein [Candidatus Shapirobacteria bacterium]MDD5481800.1 hypothetical protein [Candidatus Shapirobacteria bacterium]